MPCLTGKYNRSVGVLINVGVHKPGIVQPATIQQTPPPQYFAALVDTGATTTCISPLVANAVGLQPTGMRPMGSATHQGVPTNTYLADLGILFSGIWWFPGSQIFEFRPPANGPYQILLGRDILCQGILSVSFDGHFTFSI